MRRHSPPPPLFARARQTIHSGSQSVKFNEFCGQPSAHHHLNSAHSMIIYATRPVRCSGGSEADTKLLHFCGRQLLVFKQTNLCQFSLVGVRKAAAAAINLDASMGDAVQLPLVGAIKNSLNWILGCITTGSVIFVIIIHCNTLANCFCNSTPLLGSSTWSNSSSRKAAVDPRATPLDLLMKP